MSTLPSLPSMDVIAQVSWSGPGELELRHAEPDGCLSRQAKDLQARNADLLKEIQLKDKQIQDLQEVQAHDVQAAKIIELSKKVPGTAATGLCPHSDIPVAAVRCEP
jgi:C4-dicarboxylate-specific signal transduction histidine kinase